MSTPDAVAIVHDYLTQRGGAERVVLTMTDAFPGAPVHTSFYDPAATFDGFGRVDVRPMGLNRLGMLRAHHRLALPVLAPAFSRLRVDAPVTVCSSSGWAHGARTSGRKVVYCYTPARWLYQTDRYLGGSSRATAVGLAALAPALRRWDRRAAASADRYLAISQAVRARVAERYGIEAEVLHPPADVDAGGPTEPVGDLEPGFYLCVSRLLPYKNVEAVVTAFGQLPGERLVVVGTGPRGASIGAMAPANVSMAGTVSDAGLRWLYAASAGLVAASYEDFGLTPVEAAAFGTPTAALRWGGFLDTIVEGSTGVFFDEPRPDAIASGVAQLAARRWEPEVLTAHAGRFSVERFTRRLGEVVEAEAAAL